MSQEKIAESRPGSVFPDLWACLQGKIYFSVSNFAILRWSKVFNIDTCYCIKDILDEHIHFPFPIERKTQVEGKSKSQCS